MGIDLQCGTDVFVFSEVSGSPSAQITAEQEANDLFPLKISRDKINPRTMHAIGLLMLSARRTRLYQCHVPNFVEYGSFDECYATPDEHLLGKRSQTRPSLMGGSRIINGRRSTRGDPFGSGGGGS